MILYTKAFYLVKCLYIIMPPFNFFSKSGCIIACQKDKPTNKKNYMCSILFTVLSSEYSSIVKYQKVINIKFCISKIYTGRYLLEAVGIRFIATVTGYLFSLTSGMTYLKHTLSLPLYRFISLEL